MLTAQVGTNVELLIQDIEQGDGAEAATGDVLKVHYEGRLENGEKFDSSYDRGETFTFQLGAGRVIRGWELGIGGMKEGGKRKLIIPSELGYGPAGYGDVIPPNAKLIFEVELVDVEGKE
ncbi:MAG: peptidylprolyl isomerase [Candidatus Wildermuthbacteria bacterium RIFCSPHIGHO2_12_FULL_45_9]|uniref:Peptidyl-prolyl cis-trans isomerase n=1 Tax=Candidatus Wildermuthbacteria bacterium RIFCSPHIGHO2_02_FULL_45_25 TaxID=1802450 RepID=A0A1G2R4A3_9BACT|nr:MAG: peptidylprolyl isomerase [Candidatus Wildermuthbacteria bacterium RIFCSPHIGHO2_01_FULL_45_20]OHA67695.1 MAG: peptidylprolyl isomerase [Candidatus Wildermuthbacteria bacterium RIFCSPHIGHO2_02_FULL_45_25]OHA71003.1 MAG: peptidylprolyl isomerase [Candidatus Wildermuthbacteria bacterium RIFCSPHIGHO2_12_FULL_45_9]